MLERVWRKGDPLPLLMGMQTSIATMENSVESPLKMFRSLIRFEFIFVYGVRKCSRFIILQVVDHYEVPFHASQNGCDPKVYKQ